MDRAELFSAVDDEAMSEEQGNFKVTDRRLFNADGTPRDLPPEEKTEKAQPETASSQSISGGGIESAAAQAAPQSTARAETQTAEEDEVDVPGAEDPASFVNFIMSIASNAAAALGMIEHPVTRKRDVDLELGKHWIDILGMLQQKTMGNLSPQEQQIVESLLSDLRMQFVSLANSPSAKSASPYTGSDITGGR